MKWKGTRVLITGGMGFVGSNLAHALVARGAEVRIFDSMDPRSGCNPANLRGVDDAVEKVVGDMREPSAVAAALEGREIVFHAAAFTSHPSSMKEPLTDVAINGLGTLNLLEAIRLHHPKVRLAYVGTSTQVGRMRIDPIDEDHPEFPRDVYSASKCAAEKYILVYGTGYGLDVRSVRLANNYGPRASLRNADLGFLNYFIGLGLRNREITVFGDGAQTRNVSFIDDSVEALLASFDAPSGSVFFATADEQVTVRGIAESISRVIGGSLKFVPWPPERAAIEVGDARIRNDRIKAALGWSPRVRFEDGLARTASFYRESLSDWLPETDGPGGRG